MITKCPSVGEKSRHWALIKAKEQRNMDGYICLYRKMLGWRWMQEPLTAHLFTCLLLLANQDEGWQYKGMQLHAGQLITSLDKLVEVSGLTKREVRTRLERLQRSGELEVVKFAKCSFITIVNYSSYQFEQNTGSGTKNGTKSGTKNDTKKKAASSSVIGGNKEAGKESDTKNGTIIATKNGTITENGQNEGETAEKSGTKNGTILEPATTSQTEPKAESQQKSGTKNGTIQYSIFNQDNITEKKNKKESTEQNVVYTTSELEQLFEDFRRAYKGTKRGFKVEFDNFKRKHQSDWREIVPLLMPALMRMEEWRKQQQAAGQFVPQYAMLQTWLNQGRWTTEYEITPKDNGEAAGQCNSSSGNAESSSYTPNYDEEF